MTATAPRAQQLWPFGVHAEAPRIENEEDEVGRRRAFLGQRWFRRVGESGGGGGGGKFIHS